MSNALQLRLWPYFARLSLRTHTVNTIFAFDTHTIKTVMRELCQCIVLTCLSFFGTTALICGLPVHSSDLHIFPSKPLHCFAHEPSLLKHHRYSTTSAASAHSSDLLILHSISLRCFAPEPSFLRHNKYSTSSAAPAHSSDLLIFHSKPLNCFAPESCG